MRTIFICLFTLGNAILTHAQQQATPDNTKAIFRNEYNLTPLYIVNGEIVSQEVYEKIEAETIAQVDVLNGPSATEIYGEMAKDGALRITLKDPKAISVRKSTKEKS